MAAMLSHLRSLLQRKREIALCQITGLGMLVVALGIGLHPNSITFLSMRDIYGLEVSPLFQAACFGVCGWLLGWQAPASTWVFSLLTAPIALYGTAQLTVALVNDQQSLTAGLLSAGCYLVLQYAHIQQEGLRRWMKISATS